MRSAQVAYFKERSQRRLIVAKTFEKKVDDAIEEMITHGTTEVSTDRRTHQQDVRPYTERNLPTCGSGAGRDTTGGTGTMDEDRQKNEMPTGLQESCPSNPDCQRLCPIHGRECNTQRQSERLVDEWTGEGDERSSRMDQTPDTKEDSNQPGKGNQCGAPGYSGGCTNDSRGITGFTGGKDQSCFDPLKRDAK